MYIKELEVDNFKSFANKVTIPFLEGFTTITGPNGSGKSNIIDSVLFALGLSKTRALRAERLSDFISTHTRRNEATVKVTFAGLPNEKYGKEISVMRRIKKSSQGYNSIYYLNDKVVTLSDIHTVLEEYNITPNSYNVIMQSDVTSIVSCTRTERRGIIDEIAGVADFDRRIDQATNELQVVDERVSKASLIKSEVDVRLEQLKEEREVAIKYQKLRDEKASLDSQINTVKFFDIKRNLEKAHTNIIDFTKKKKQEESAQKNLEEQLENVKNEHEKISELVKEKGEAQKIEIEQQALKKKSLINENQNEINYADKQIQDSKKLIENSKNGISVQEQKIVDTELKINLKKDEIKKIQNDIDDKNTELKKILEEQAGLTKVADDYLSKLNELRKEKASLQEQEAAIIKEQLPIENDLKNVQRGIEESKEKIEKLIDFKNKFASKKDLLEVQVEELKREMGDLKIVQQNVLHDLDKTKNERDDLSYEMQAAFRKVSTMEAQKKVAEDANFGRAVETIMDAKLKGVHAPLAKLGTVDKEYSTAMEVAVGGRMAHIVVDDEHTAKVAIELIKSSNAGRATFIPLNKIAKAPTKLSLPKEKGVIDYAINLIDFDDQYLDAFYYAVGDTLVVEDYECACKFIRKYRVVTLDGEIIEKSGSISGGAAKRMGIRFSENEDAELEEFKNKVLKMKETYDALNEKIKNLEKKLDDVRTNYTNSSTEYSKASIELSSLEKEAGGNTSSIEECENYIKENEPKINEFNKQLDKLEEKHISVSEKIIEVQEKINEVESLIDDKDLKALKEKTEGVEFEIKRLNTNMNNANNDISLFGGEIEFSKTIIETKKEEIENAEKNIKDLEIKKVENAANIKKLEAELVVLEEEIAKITEKLGELLAQRDSINNRLIELETQKGLKIKDIELIEEQIESFKARRRELEPQLNSAKETLEQAGVEIEKLEPVEMSIEEINAKIARLQKRMDDLGAVNMRAIEAFDEVSARQKQLNEQIETLAKERVEILERMQGYEQVKKEAFMKTYNNINVNFKEIFHRLSEGEGTLILDNEEDPLSGGLTIEAQPRDKVKTKLEGLSGGEKTLTALAFVFAIQKYMPAPFYALDEIDANLDAINIEKIADLVKSQSGDTQFVVVSHRKPMIESANRTIGVTQKDKGITQVTGVKLHD